VLLATAAGLATVSGLRLAALAAQDDDLVHRRNAGESPE